MLLINLDPFSRINDSWPNKVKNKDLDFSIPFMSYIDKDIKGEPNNNDYLQERYQPDFYKKFALDIVTETVFDYPNPSITEKTFRPMVCKKIFIIVGAPYTLSVLRDHGFKTFHPIINESYDIETDPEKRMIMLQEEILKFCNYELDYVKMLFKECREILNHNYFWIEQAKQNELDKIKKQINYV